MNTAHTQLEVDRSAFWPLIVEDISERAMDTIIPQAETLIKNLFEKYPDHRLERHQLTSLVAIALETDSPQVLLDFVRYQIGRDNNSTSWRKGSPSFGAAMLDSLQGLEKTAGGLIDTAVESYAVEPPDRAAELTRLWMLLARRFVGSLQRNYVYYSALRDERRKK